MSNAHTISAPISLASHRVTSEPARGCPQSDLWRALVVFWRNEDVRGAAQSSALRKESCTSLANTSYPHRLPALMAEVKNYLIVGGLAQ